MLAELAHAAVVISKRSSRFREPYDDVQYVLLANAPQKSNPGADRPRRRSRARSQPLVDSAKTVESFLLDPSNLASMSIGQSLLPEFDLEMASTRRLLERVPSDKGQWKPHAKSFPLGHLAQLVSIMPGWLTRTVRGTEIDLSKSAGYSFEKTDTLLSQFDQHVREAREALASAKDLISTSAGR